MVSSDPQSNVHIRLNKRGNSSITSTYFNGWNTLHNRTDFKTLGTSYTLFGFENIYRGQTGHHSLNDCELPDFQII